MQTWGQIEIYDYKAALAAHTYTQTFVFLSTWDPAKTSAHGVLSSGNTVLNADVNGNRPSSLGTVSKASGKWYFTVTIGTTTGNNAAGVGNSSMALTNNVGFDANGWGLFISASLWKLDHNSATTSTGVTPANGDVINVAWDAAGSLYLGINGTYYDNTGTATGSTPTTATFTSVTGTLFPAGTANATNANITINVNPGSTPSGFTNWG